jgi:hypothetical protein
MLLQKQDIKCQHHQTHAIDNFAPCDSTTNAPIHKCKAKAKVKLINYQRPFTSADCAALEAQASPTFPVNLKRNK